MRFPDESDEAFRERATRTAEIGRVLVDACLRNKQVQELLAQGFLTVRGLKGCPIVRIDFEQAYAIGHPGETLHATRNKRWGDGPYVLPLEPDDRFLNGFITYFYKPESVYNRRFNQRVRLKELLGKNRKVVGNAKYWTKEMFLKHLTQEQTSAIRRCIGVEPGVFWRAAKGKIFLELPPREVQKEFPFE